MGSFNAVKTKTQLKLAVTRLNLLRQKKAIINQQTKQEISNLIKSNKISSAKIQVHLPLT